jgi:hypothetical protein
MTSSDVSGGMPPRHGVQVLSTRVVVAIESSSLLHESDQA